MFFPGIEQANPEYNWVKWGEMTVLSGRKLKMEHHGYGSYNTMYEVGPGFISKWLTVFFSPYLWGGKTRWEFPWETSGPLKKKTYVTSEGRDMLFFFPKLQAENLLKVFVFGDTVDGWNPVATA